MAHLLHLPEMHLPEAFRHALRQPKAWYWAAAAAGVAILVAYLLIVFGIPMEGAADWGFAA